MGVFWMAAAVMQIQSNRSGKSGNLLSRSNDVDQTDVVTTAPDIEDVSSESETTDGEGTSIDVTDANPAPEVEGDDPTDDVDETDVVDTEPDIEDVDEE